MNSKNSRIRLVATSILAASALMACGGDDPAPMGTVSASLTDAPACGFDAVNVTVSKVRVHSSSGADENASGWTDITLSPARKINLLNLTNGALEQLGSAPLAAGHYTQVRLVLDANTGNGMANTVVKTGSTTELSLDTPSAVQSGLKLNAQFDVAAGERTDLVIDFDACKSIVPKGNGKYALKPVLKVIPTVLNGISGFVSLSQLPNKVMVSAQQNGQVVSSTVPNAVTGEFMLARLVPGNYDVVITADASAASVIGAVPVATTTSTTPLSTAASQAGSISGTVVLAPASTAEAGYVAAMQTFAAGPAVTIKYAAADLISGVYSVDGLPLAAPQYAAYTASLPLAFAPGAVTPGAAQYRMSASAVGYATQTHATPVDISVMNATNINFSLAP